MEALQTVFDYIREIVDLIKKFFGEIMGIVKPEGEETEGEENA